MNMEHTNIPTSLEECKTVEQTVAFYVNKGYSKYEACEIIQYMCYDPWSHDACAKPSFEWY